MSLKTIQSDDGAFTFEIRDTREIPCERIIELYRANNWSSADKPEQLHQALINSHTLLSAWSGDRLVGIGNAISDGALVVYYSHMLVHPDFHGRGVGSAMLKIMQERYGDFHQQILVADGASVDFYAKHGFTRAGSTVPMWIFDGHEH